LPELPNLANCKGENYHCGWASKGTEVKDAAKENLIECDNGYHAWCNLSHLYGEISKDTNKTLFHPSLHCLGDLATRNGTSDLPGWQDHTDSEHESLLQWDDGVRAILTNDERSCAETAHAQYHEHGNIHGMAPEHMGHLWQGVWAPPDMPKRDEISYSCATKEGDAGAAPSVLDVLVNPELSVERHAPVVSHVADNKRSQVLQILTKSTAHKDIIPDGSLTPDDLSEIPKGCPPMTKMLMHLWMTKKRHPFAGMRGLDFSTRKALTDLCRRLRTYTGPNAPPDEHLQNLSLQDVCEINVARWLVFNLKGDGEQKWEYINAHMITLNVPYYVEHNLVQWLDGANVRPNAMCPHRFPMRHSLRERKGEKLGQAGYAVQDTPEKITEAVIAMYLWVNQLYVKGFIDQVASSMNMYDVCAGTEAGESNYADASLIDDEWTLKPIKWIQDSKEGNFVLFKFGWTAEQDINRQPQGVEVTEIFHGTSPLTVVPIALARGLTALREDDGNHVESHIAEAATYFAPGPMSRNNWSRRYADPSRLFADCDPQSAVHKVDELSADNAACIRVYFKCVGFGPKIPNKSKGQKDNMEICFGPGMYRIKELWITVGEPQNTAKAVSYFAVPETMTCLETKEVIDARVDGKPIFMFENDSLNMIHPAPMHRWTATTWNPINSSPGIQY